MKRKHNLTKISNISWTIEKIVIFIVLNFFPPQKQKAEKTEIGQSSALSPCDNTRFSESTLFAQLYNRELFGSKKRQIRKSQPQKCKYL